MHHDRTITNKLSTKPLKTQQALKAEAATIDPTPFPPTRRLTTWTPPVPGFEAGKYDLPGAI